MDELGISSSEMQHFDRGKQSVRAKQPLEVDPREKLEDIIGQNL